MATLVRTPAKAARVSPSWLSLVVFLIVIVTCAALQWRAVVAAPLAVFASALVDDRSRRGLVLALAGSALAAGVGYGLGW